MGLFSGKKPPPWSPPPQPPIDDAVLAESSAFMDEWTRIVGQASDPVFWGALERFGRIGGAIQGQATWDALRVASAQDVYGRPWRRWADIAARAIEVSDFTLACRVYLFAWCINNQVTFDIDTLMKCGFERPHQDEYNQLARLALDAANRAPSGFSVVERTIEAPVTRRALQVGLSQLLGVDPPPEDIPPASASANQPDDSPFNAL